jgi:hypothetical protein
MRATELCRVFQLLDDLHFGGQLRRSGWQVTCGHPRRGGRVPCQADDSCAYALHVWGLTVREKRIIIVDCGILGKESALRMVLLREMINAHSEMSSKMRNCSRSPHGLTVVRELHRMADRGEGCLQPEVRYYEGALARRANHRGSYALPPFRPVVQSGANDVDEIVAAHCLWCGRQLGKWRRFSGNSLCSVKCLREYNGREL